MDLEAVWYEYSPYLYAMTGVASILSTRSPLSIISGLVLVAAAAIILRKRYLHRKEH